MEYAYVYTYVSISLLQFNNNNEENDYATTRMNVIVERKIFINYYLLVITNAVSMLICVPV